jgi:hypothetical protein
MFENDINFDDEDFFEKLSNNESPLKINQDEELKTPLDIEEDAEEKAEDEN